MTPLFFGDSKHPLWGVMHEPPASVERGHGVLLCPPIGHEYVRSHWALRQLASQLARAGYHVLRFDWSGVGDSAGDLQQATVEQWLKDVAAAAEELRDSAGIPKLSLAGLRFGAALAALAARKVRAQLLVLWDPIIDGAAYLDELEKLHDAALRDEKRFWSRWPMGMRPYIERFVPGAAPPRVRAADELVGTRYSEALLRSIRGVTMERLLEVPRRVAWVHSAASEGARAYFDALTKRGIKVEERTTSAQTAWSSPARVDELFLPGDATLAVTSCFDAPS